MLLEYSQLALWVITELLGGLCSSIGREKLRFSILVHVLWFRKAKHWPELRNLAHRTLKTIFSSELCHFQGFPPPLGVRECARAVKR